MVRLGERRRETLIEKTPDMANAVAVSTFLSQFLTERPFSIELAMAGVGVWLALWMFTLALAKEYRR